MEEDWDESPSTFVAANQNSAGFDDAIDTGRNFFKGRGFTKSTKNDSDDSWGGSGGGWGSGGGGGGRSNNGSSGHRSSEGKGFRGKHGEIENKNLKSEKNKSDNFSDAWDDNWGSNNNDNWGGNKKRTDDVGCWGDLGGHGNEQRKRKGRNVDNECNAGWGNIDNKKGEGGRGGRGGGRGGRDRGDGNGFGGGGRNFGNAKNDDNGWGDKNDDNGWGSHSKNDDEGWGGSSDNNDRGRGRGRGRGSRGGRGGFNDGGRDGGGWGDNDSGGFGRSRGGGRGRGGRGGDGWGGDGKNEDAMEKPREIYVPPDPTNDLAEMFSTAISSGINFDKYDNIPVEVSGNELIESISSFESSGMRPLILENVKKSGYTRPTPIQKTAIPIIMAGRDVMACAQTGSGKTAAFLLPIINCLIANKTDLIVDSSHVEPQVVIVSPTRELAIQIHQEARKFAYDTGLKCAIAYGGASVMHQIKQLMNGCHILVATPGRMNDFVSKNRISFSSVRFVILDEADRMLDMGFLPDIEKMLNHETMVPTGDRQTLMFSATFPEEIQRLASNYLSNYLFITIGIVGGACTDVQQVFYEVEIYKKREKLLELLRNNTKEKTLVFVETKRNADFIATFLSENNLPSTSIHGDRLQSQREEALRDFKSGCRNILVATDVAARGLDIKNVQHVINYDLPKNIDEYVHRIGRTGRVGNSGRATSFFESSSDNQLAANLVKILRQAGQDIPSWLQSAASGGYGGYEANSFGGRDVRDDFNQPDISNQAVEDAQEDW